MIEVILKPDYQKLHVYVLDNMRRLNSDSIYWKNLVRSHVWRPPTDVFESEEAVIVRVEIAGMQEADFSVVLDGRYLVIRGFRQDTTERRAYHQIEIRFGEFTSEVDLPYSIDVEHIEAVYQGGFLRVTMPRELPKTVHIKE